MKQGIEWEYVKCTQEEELKIAISAEGKNLESRVGQRLGDSQYLVIVDLETMAFEAVPNPGASGQGAAGIQAVVLAISKEANRVFTGYCSPTAKKYLAANGIQIFTGVVGTVAEVLEKYREGNYQDYKDAEARPEASLFKIDKAALIDTIRNSANQFVNLLPILASVILLIGLFNAFVSRELLCSLFSGNTILDTFYGAFFGSILAGNPINSYVIGGKLLEYGVGLFAITSFIVAWVTVGLIQLPVEIAVLGKKFALVRNVVSFVVSIAIAILTVVVLNTVRGLFY